MNDTTLNNLPLSNTMLAALAGLLLGAAADAHAFDLKTLEATNASAKAALASGDFGRACTEYEALLRDVPEHPGFQLPLAQCLIARGRLEEASAIVGDILDEGFGVAIANEPAFAKLAGRPNYETQRARAAEQSRVLAPAVRAFDLPEPRFIAEGVAFDPGSGRFFVSSTYLRKIVVHEADGRVADFVRSGDHGLLQVLGMKVDVPRSRLVALTATDDARLINFKPSELGRSGALTYDLATGHLLQASWLGASGTHLFNDLVLAADGTAYITDSDEGRIYRLSADGRALSPVTAADALLSPNGIDIEPARKLLYVADLRGLSTVDIVTGAVQPMPHPKAVSAVEIDGLYLHGNDLIGVQNPRGLDRVVAFHLSPDHRQIVSAQALERADPRLSAATEGVLVGDKLYFIATSYLDAPDEKGRIAAPERTTPTTILELQLPPS